MTEGRILNAPTIRLGEEYKKGFEARRANINRNDCPYPADTKRAKMWTECWNHENENIHETARDKREKRAFRNAAIAFFALPTAWMLLDVDPLNGNNFEQIGAMTVVAGLVYGVYKMTMNW